MDVENGLEVSPPVKLTNMWPAIRVCTTIFLITAIMLDYSFYYKPLADKFIAESQCIFDINYVYSNGLESYYLINATLMGCESSWYSDGACSRSYIDTKLNTNCFIYADITSNGNLYKKCQYFNDDIINTLYICPCENPECLSGKLGPAVATLVFLVLLSISIIIFMFLSRNFNCHTNKC
jgi:hypothetical protein